MSQFPEAGFLLGRQGDDPARDIGFVRPERVVAPLPDAGSAYLADEGDGHAMIFAPTGAGKKRNILLPTLLTSRNPMIVVDIKGELARESADYRRRVLGHQVVMLDPWNELGNETPDGFNPLDVISRADAEISDDAFAFARLLFDEGPLKEAYWDESSQAVIAGLIAHVVSGEAETDRSFRRVWTLANGDDTIYGLATLLDSQKVNPFSQAQIAGLLSLSADTTRSCIVSVMHQHLRVFSSATVQAATAATTFPLEKVVDGSPLTIYIVVPPHRLKSHAALLRIWLAAFLTLIFQRRRRPGLPTLMLVDEAAQLGRMHQIPQAVTLARGYGLRCMLLWQSVSQLRHAYDKEADALLENCASLVTFGHSAFSMSRQTADALGDIPAERLFAMTPKELALRKAGEATRIVHRIDYLAEPELARRAGANPMYASEHQRASGRQSGPGSP